MKPRILVHNPSNHPVSHVPHTSLSEALSAPAYPIRIPLRDLAGLLVLADLGHQAIQCHTPYAFSCLLTQIEALQRCPNTPALLAESSLILSLHDHHLSRIT